MKSAWVCDEEFPLAAVGWTLYKRVGYLQGRSSPRSLHSRDHTCCWGSIREILLEKTRIAEKSCCPLPRGGTVCCPVEFAEEFFEQRSVAADVRNCCVRRRCWEGRNYLKTHTAPKQKLGLLTPEERFLLLPWTILLLPFLEDFLRAIWRGSCGVCEANEGVICYLLIVVHCLLQLPHRTKGMFQIHNCYSDT